VNLLAQYLLLATFAGPQTSLGMAPTTEARPTVYTKTCRVPGIDADLRCGTLEVFENRAARRGRILHLNFVVLPARKSPAAAEPVILLYGGPGQTATEYVANEWNSWRRDEHEVILLDQRGTGGDNTLDCELPGTESAPRVSWNRCSKLPFLGAAGKNWKKTQI
jgi:pimeloyl-ACP methyl ester carboxylesterase